MEPLFNGIMALFFFKSCVLKEEIEFKTRSKIYNPYVIIVAIILGVFYFYIIKNIIAVLIVFGIPFIGSFFTSYKILKDHVILNSAEFWNKKIHISRIKTIEPIRNNAFKQFLGMPKNGYKIRYNTYDDLIIYPKNEQFISLLEEKMNAYVSDEIVA